MKKIIFTIGLIFLLTGCSYMPMNFDEDYFTDNKVTEINITPNVTGNITFEVVDTSDDTFIYFPEKTNSFLIVNNNDVVLVNPGNDIGIIGEARAFSENLSAVIFTSHEHYDSKIMEYVDLKFEPKAVYGTSLITDEGVNWVLKDEFLSYNNFSVILKPDYKNGFIEDLNQNVIIMQVIFEDTNQVVTFLNGCGSQCEDRIDFTSLLETDYLIVDEETSISSVILLNADNVLTYSNNSYESIGVETKTITIGEII